MTYDVLIGTLNPTHSFIHSLTHSLTHSLAHSHTHWRSSFVCERAVAWCVFFCRKGDEAGQSGGGEVVEQPTGSDAVSTSPPAAGGRAPPVSSSSTSRIPRLTSSLRRRLPFLAGQRHDHRDSRPPPPCSDTATAAAIGTVQPATPPSSKVSDRTSY